MPIPPTTFDQVERLVAKFKALPTRERHAYNEDNTRKDFILPLFHALEWNTADAREVTAEEKISRGYVDFAFRIGGIPRLMLETKRVGENLNDPRWAQQAIDYAYHKDVTWALLSDFEGLKVLNAEAKEAEPLAATFISFTVDDYLPRLAELWLLSRPAMADGALDREAERVFKKIPKTPITQSLFDNLTRWRADLYKNLRAYNKLWADKDIDDAVQRILDRLIFIRTAEDRGVEGDKLRALVRELRDQNRLNDLIPALSRRFRALDAIYNSQLFAPHLCEDLTYEPTTLVNIVEEMYGAETGIVRYNFAFIDADVLGRAYEQYLGVAMARRGSRGGVLPPVKGRDAPAATKSKRKSEGIYYTPTFVVKYIVQQTLGRYLDERGYDPAQPVRVLDPACGSGSFLIEAFDVLDKFLAREKGQARGAYDMQDHARQMQILTQNIFGVDKDAQAVEVAQLNLLLKALHLREKLPKLDNVRCGDSLISGTPKELEQFFGANAKEKNAFNWEREFSKVMAEGGFDVVVGNPPWGANIDDDLDYFHDKYPATTQEHTDSFKLFIERGLQLVCEGGLFGMIVPNTLLRQRRLKDARSLLLQNEIVIIADLGENVFQQVVAPSCVFVVRKHKPDERHKVRFLDLSHLAIEEKVRALNVETPSQIKQSDFLKNADLEFAGGSKLYSVSVAPLGDLDELECKDAGINYQRVNVGMQEKGKSDFAERLLYEGKRQKTQDKMYWKGSDIDRYWIAEKTERYCRPNYENFTRANEVVHLSTKVYKVAPKILFRQTADHIIATIDYRGVWFGRSIIAILPARQSDYRLEYFLALLNSRYFDWLYRNLVRETGRVFAQVKLSKIKQLPIRRINFADAAEKQQHDAIVA
ncbi:MAG: N-6 DNA methylase, partial [Chloroflexota bacterium]